MKDSLYRKISKVLNEDLNMILSDDDFEEPEIGLDVHMLNILKKINLQILTKNVTVAIENTDMKLLKKIIEEEWDGENPIFVVSDDNIKMVITFSVYTLGNKANLNWIDTSNVTNMELMFLMSEFNGDISKWDVSSVTNMQCMFYKSKFNGDISSWNVSNVLNMACMFAHSKFNGDISKWDVSSVTNIWGMFFMGVFNGDISQWDVSSVTNMAWMFTNCPIKEEHKPKFND